MLNIEINNQTKTHVCRRRLTRFLSSAAKQLKQKQPQTLSFAIVGETAIRKLNKLHRRQDKVTDVLSFEENDFVDPENVLGEIIICLPRAKKQAKEFRHSLIKEVHRLALHGYMHLLGYDHIKAKEAEKMEALEKNIFNKYYA